MKFYLGLALAFAITFIQIAAGLKCSSSCAACWKDGHPGVDIKFTTSAKGNHFGTWCPKGYHGLHCAKTKRCICHNTKGDCKEFGPCLCPFTRDPMGNTVCPSRENCRL